MKHKTSELTGALLDAAVALAQGARVDGDVFFWPRGAALMRRGWQPSTNWDQGGPIIERERIDVTYSVHFGADCWGALMGDFRRAEVRARGPTPLIAAMRAFVASKLGDEVELP